MKTAKATVAAILYTSKTLANGEHPIMLRICYNGRRKYKSTGLSCTVKLWNESKSEVRERHPLATNMNILINAQTNMLRNKVLDFEMQGQHYSAESLVESATRQPPTRKTLFDLFEERIAFFRDTTKKHNTATGYQTLLNIIKRFSDDRVIELFEINDQWIRELEIYLQTRYADTSIKKFFNVFKALMNYACLNGVIETNPFTNYRFSRRLDMRTTKRALSVDEMHAIVRYYIDNYYIKGGNKPDLEVTVKRYWHSRYFQRRGTNKFSTLDAEQFALSMFICSYIFQGLALVDLAKLRWKDLVEIKILDKEKYTRDCAEHGAEYADSHKVLGDFYEINITRTKTQHPTRIFIEKSVVQPFMEPFMRSKRHVPNDFVFPIYCDDDARHRFERLSYATHLVNSNLQRVASRIGLLRKITFYSARHTYATMLYHADVPLPLIAQNMGRNPAEIETYFKDFDTDKIINANRQIWHSSIKALEGQEIKSNM